MLPLRQVLWDGLEAYMDTGIQAAPFLHLYCKDLTPS